MSEPTPTTTAPPEPTERRVRCPACQSWCLFSPRNPYRPFCSPQCKGLDLGAWASESFRLPEDTPPDGPFGDPRLQ
jgi:endogenous inhibitor of DNA gyrase (YacG/DUF329 family)